ncbi:Methylated-DNA--protein-cysteine methyltransferase [Candidatus Terasakiella magnetica]|uniref:Methylated-DNA--protein-cysteine methyltransferase n=1 Tax=Candidatus Terasakiella magnetica TaxID=1867952 RepID=A0A1C3RGM9_9PROT|nr:methylated-DNA--[protein]-cysteine S-methyltransferase [Candidatus Terasakiella magnetica]SCA56354.1 Methylated-DNA--protein-cysteine methyltransferase [Candidatus Terasakiella magnetica]
MDIKCTSIMSPVGTLSCFEEDDKIIVLEWGQVPQGIETPLLKEAKAQISAYFSAKLTQFDLPVDPHGTDHQKKVWQKMCEIPFGETRSYGDIAKELNSAAQAVGSACGKNPIPIIIPCHRIIGSNGNKGGYSGGEGLETKEQLLRLEQAVLTSRHQTSA